ncbi:MAG: iron-containing alcohol dehydrogenase [Chloroflexota bacterium]|nr:MAG: iron-containing alcohol dehydrogenase [Chloroflexota bacterium]
MAEIVASKQAGAPRGTYSPVPIGRFYFGAGALRENLANEADRLGIKRAMIVTGKTLSTKTDLVDQLKEALGVRCAGVFSGALQNTPTASIMAGVALARDLRADAVISLGGSSPVDVAKGIALVLAEGNDWERMRPRFVYPNTIEIPKLEKPKIPFIAITTTLSGSEFTHVVGITHEDERRKLQYPDPQVAAKAVFLDPLMTLATPHDLWANTGVKCLYHAIESNYSLLASPPTQTSCLKAISLVNEHLVHSLEHPDEVDPRGYLQIASWTAVFFGSINTWVGVGHAIDHMLGGRLNVQHGVAAAISMPCVMDFNRKTAAPQLAAVARAMGVDTANMSDDEAAAAASNAVRALVKRVGLPSRLRDVGATVDDLEPLARDSFADFSLFANPRHINGHEEVLEILEKMY